QRFRALNVARGSHAIINFTAAAFVLWAWHDITGFAIWTVVAAVIEVSLYVGAVLFSRRPPDSRSTTADVPAVWRYAFPVAVTTALSLILTQSDRVILARLTTASQLGVYAAAYNLLLGLALLQL